MKNTLVSAILASAMLGACSAPAVAGHYVYVQPRLKKVYVVQPLPRVVVNRYVPYYPVRQVIYVRGPRRHAAGRAVFVHRNYRPVQYDWHRHYQITPRSK